MQPRHFPTIKTAALASEDYPELEEILEQRLPPRRAIPTNRVGMRRTASRAATARPERLFTAYWRAVADANDEGFNEADFDSTTDADPTEAQDPDLGLRSQADWHTVQQKAHDIYQIGGVHILATTGTTVAADVLGDNGTYQSELDFEPGDKGRNRTVANWKCTCPWAAYSFGRSGRWAKYEGRMCSHALALLYQFQSNPDDTRAADWDTAPITYYTAPKPKEWRIGLSREAETALKVIYADTMFNEEPNMQEAPNDGLGDTSPEPEAALPETEGEIGPGHASLQWIMGSDPKKDSADIAKAARAYLETGTTNPEEQQLQQLGVKTFNYAEQRELIDEGEGSVVASNLDRLDIRGTHYEALEAQLQEAESRGEPIYWW